MLNRELSAGYLTNWAGRLLIRTISPKLEAHGLSVGYLPVFFTLTENPKLSQKRIAEIIEVEQPTMAATLARMERDGLIVRTPDPTDGRSALISLTAKAREKLSIVERAVNETNDLALSGLKPAERKQFFEMMKRIVVALGGDL